MAWPDESDDTSSPVDQDMAALQRDAELLRSAADRLREYAESSPARDDLATFVPFAMARLLTALASACERDHLHSALRETAIETAHHVIRSLPPGE